MQSVQEPNIFLSLLPLLMVTVVLFLFAIPIGRRKGRSFGFTLLVLIPFVGPFVLIYLVSLTDRQVLDRLAALEGNWVR
jgi:hypothetical protein